MFESPALAFDIYGKRLARSSIASGYLLYLAFRRLAPLGESNRLTFAQGLDVLGILYPLVEICES